MVEHRDVGKKECICIWVHWAGNWFALCQNPNQVKADEDTWTFCPRQDRVAVGRDCSHPFWLLFPQMKTKQMSQASPGCRPRSTSAFHLWVAPSGTRHQSSVNPNHFSLELELEQNLTFPTNFPWFTLSLHWIWGTHARLQSLLLLLPKVTRLLPQSSSSYTMSHKAQQSTCRRRRHQRCIFFGPTKLVISSQQRVGPILTPGTHTKNVSRKRFAFFV